MTNSIDALSDALMQARLSATPLPEFPGTLPQTAKTAYAVQNRSIQHWETPLAGFKVGGIPEKFRDQFKANWLAGAIFTDEIFEIQNGKTKDAPVFKNGFAAYEPEWILFIDDMDWNAAPPTTIEQVRALITRVHMGMEIASSPMPMINQLGPGAIISDFGNNTSAWVGPKADLSVLSRLEDYTVRTVIDGELIGEKAASSGEDGPLGAVMFLLTHLHNYRDQLDLPKDLLISSGAVTGVHDSHIGTTGEIEFEGIGKFALNLVEKAPSAPA